MMPKNISENAIDIKINGKNISGSCLLAIKFKATKGKNNVKIRLKIIKNLLIKIMHHLTNVKLCIVL